MTRALTVVLAFCAALGGAAACIFCVAVAVGMIIGGTYLAGIAVWFVFDYILGAI